MPADRFSVKTATRMVALISTIIAVLAIGASSAFAASPWWHLTSGARPTFLSSGHASPEVQQVTVNATDGFFFLTRPETFATTEHSAKLEPTATHEEMQEELESPEMYGPGNVEVTGGPLASGTGTVFGPVAATGKLTSGSATVEEVPVEKAKQFVVGQTIEGAGIPAATTILAVEGEELTLSANATASASGVSLTGVASTLVSNVATAAGAFAVGQELSGNGIAAGAKIAAVGSGTLTLSQAPTAAGGAAVTLVVLAPYTVTFTGALAGRPLELMNASGFLSGGKREAKTTELSRGRPDGEIVLTAVDLGDAPIDGATTPVTLTDALPAGLEAVSVTAGLTAVETNVGILHEGSVQCTLETLLCTFAGTLPPYAEIEVRIGVSVGFAVSGEPNRVAISGGGAPPASLSRPIQLGATTPFGVEEYEMQPEEEGGAQTTQAGSHPFQLTTSITLNQQAATVVSGKYNLHPAGLAKQLGGELPAGLIGNPTNFPTCSLAQFLATPNGSAVGSECPASTVLGVAVTAFNEPEFVGLITDPEVIYNVEPAAGEPARFGFKLPVTPVLIDASVRSGGDYGLTATSHNISQTAGLISSQLVFWGVPGDPRHDNVRGLACLHEARGEPLEPGETPCRPLEQAHPPAFLTMPTSCSHSPLLTSIDAASWANPGELLNFPSASPMATLDGCNRLPFSPAFSAEPSSDKASAPSGLDVNIDFHDEGLLNPEGLAQSQLNKTVVTLPEGFTINPSSGVGLAGCTSADYARETVESAAGAGCPNESKLGTVEVTTPLLSTPIHGSLFIAQPHENPFNSLVALYIVAKDPQTGVLIKLAGKVTPNPVTGQLTTTFENNPQLPFDHFNFHFREGAQAPLITPAACGTYTTTAQLTPWSNPTAALTDTSSFTITKGFDGGACPSGGVAPFHPGIQSGMLNNNAGVFSPFYLHLTRTDGEQEISGFSTNLPAGLTGNLTGIPFCGEAAIAAARTKTGREEEASPSCPASSQVGHTLVGTGVGAVLAYVPGKVYLAGPFHGAPFSLIAVTSAVVGPFDLGTVVLRFGLNIDPYTAQVSVSPTTSEPIPTIIDGIVTHVRDIRVYIDRQNFTLNPTSCNPLVIGSTLTASQGASATIASPFQAANCANLKFAPKFAVSTSGKTSKANGASLTVKLTYPNAPQGSQANIAKVKVDLPKQLPSRLTTLQKACTAAQFNTNPAGCPAASFIGHAKAVTPLIPVPLEGPAIFVSHGGEAFPSLIMVLQGYGVTIDLVGSTFISKAGITSSTFKAVPDQPVGSFELTLPQGKFSALAANGNLCTSKLTMPTEFVAQNGAKISQSTSVSVTGCAKKKALTRAQKLAAALKLCNKKAKGKRAACRASARKKYGPVARKKSKGKSKA